MLEVRGEEGREVDPGLDLERGRVLGRGGDIGRVDNTGVGAWTCIDMARVGRARSGTRPRLIEGLRGEGTGEDLRGSVVMGVKQWSAYDRKRGDVRRQCMREREEVLR